MGTADQLQPDSIQKGSAVFLYTHSAPLRPAFERSLDKAGQGSGPYASIAGNVHFCHFAAYADSRLTNVVPALQAKRFLLVLAIVSG